jgi:transglutaminase-like putative cysteine protease
LVEQRIWLEDFGNRILLSMYPALTIASDDLRWIAQDRRDLALESPDPFPGRVHYVVQSAYGAPPDAVYDLEVNPRLPRDGESHVSPRLREFAQTLAARFGDPTDAEQHHHIARRIRDYLSSEEFQYSLDRGESDRGGDLIEDFLFDNKRGHCEYFASAMTLLCQCVGIRARLVSGYLGGEFNPVGGFYQFRQKDAHAWVEVHLPEKGWVTFDPSPPAERAARRAYENVLAEARRLLDFLEFKWATLVISFDTDTRADLFGRFAAWFDKLLAELRTGEDRPASLADTFVAFLWGPEVLSWWQRVCYWLLLVLCVTLAVLVLRVLWIVSLMAREFISTRQDTGARIVRRPEAKFFDRLLLLLANKGHVKPEHLTPREFAAGLARRSQDLSELPEFTEWFYRAQYGRWRIDSDRWQRLKSFLQRLREDSSFGAR